MKVGRPRAYPEGAVSKSFYLPLSVCIKLERVARERGVSPARIVVEALQLYFERLEAQPSPPVSVEEVERELRGLEEAVAQLEAQGGVEREKVFELYRRWRRLRDLLLQQGLRGSGLSERAVELFYRLRRLMSSGG